METNVLQIESPAVGIKCSGIGRLVDPHEESFLQGRDLPDGTDGITEVSVVLSDKWQQVESRLFCWHGRAVPVFVLLTLFLLLGSRGLKAQQIAVKTNLLYDVLSIPSLGVEGAVSNHYTLSLMGSYNPISYGGTKWKNFSFQPEGRYWFCHSFSGPYVGANLLWGGMNLDKLHIGGLHGKHRQGHFIGTGVIGGYSLRLSSRCSFDFSLGFDLVHAKYDRYREGGNPYKEGRYCSNTVLPIGTGVSFIYYIK